MSVGPESAALVGLKGSGAILSKMKAKRRIRPNVEIVSMVNRPSSRVPFRVMKSAGDDMGINLSMLFKSEAAVETAEVVAEAAAPTPTVVAVMVAKSITKEAATAAVEAAGFQVSDIEAQDAGYIFKQEGWNDADTEVLLLKASEEVGVAVAHVAKMFEQYCPDTVSFKEMVATNGLYGMLNVAKDAVAEVIYNALRKADSSDEAASTIAVAIDDFKGYVTGLLKSIPVVAFKSEDIVFKSEDRVSKAEPEVVAEAAPAVVIDTAKDEPAQVEKAEGAQEAEAETAKAVEAEGEPEKVETVEKTAEVDPMKAMFDGMFEQVQGLINGVTETVQNGLTNVQKSVEDLGVRVTEVEGVAKVAKSTVEKVISTPAPAERMPVTKHDAPRGAELIDTGLRRLDD